MTKLRAAGFAAIAAGLILGTLADRPPGRTIPRAAEHFVLAGDFHVHSFLGDGGLAPWEMPREARRRGLDVIAITNHNQVLAAKVAFHSVDPGRDPMVLVGQEITAAGFHIVAAGISRTVDWRQPARAAIRAVQEQGGVVIAAHPVRAYWRTRDDEARRLLDGLEAAHPTIFENDRHASELREFHAATAQRNPGVAPIGSSDFHFGGTLGVCRTFLFASEVSQRGVLEAIREGRTVAFDGRGGFIGEPTFVSQVKALYGSSPGGPGQSLWSRLSVWLTLVGVVVVLLFR